MENYGNINFPEDEKQPLVQLDIKKLLGKCKRNWYWIIAFALISLLAGHLYIRYSYPIYLVGARVINKATEEQELSSTFLGKSQAQVSPALLINEIELLQSRNLVERVINDLGFWVSYFNVGRVKDIEIYPYEYSSPILVNPVLPKHSAYYGEYNVVIGSDSEYTLSKDGEKWKGTFGRLLSTEWGDLTIVPNRRADVDQVKFIIHEPNELVNSFTNSYKVVGVSASGNVLDLTLKYTHAVKAQAFIQKIITYYDESIISDKNRVTVKTDEFLQRRIEELSIELRESEDEMVDFLINNDLLVNNLASKSDAVRSMLQKIKEDELNIAMLKSQVQHLLGLILTSKDEMSGGLIPKSMLYDFAIYNTEIPLPNRNFSTLFDMYIELLNERDSKRLGATAGNPMMRSINSELDSLSSYLISGLKYAENELDHRVKQIKQQENQLYQQLLDIPELRIPFQKIERLRSIKEQLYFSLLQQREQIKLSQATTVSEMKILMDPRLIARVSTSEKEIYLYCLVVGFLFPIIVLAVVIMMENTLDSPDEISKRTNVPVIASIGHSKSKKEIVVHPNTRTGMAEMFRLLRTNLSFFTNTGQRAVVRDDKSKNLSMLVTSSISGDGKTFIVVNMGMSMAIAGKRVCLINIDLRKPKLARYLGKDDEVRGLSNYLSGTMTLDEVIEPTDAHENLFLIPSGPIPPNPAELLLTLFMHEAVSRLKEKFDVIIFDAPPIGAVADAFAMQPYVDISLFIVRYRHSRLDALHLIQNAKDEKKLPNPAIVLNDAREFQNSYSYGYGYGYGYGYYEDDRSKRHWLKKQWKKLFKR